MFNEHRPKSVKLPSLEEVAPDLARTSAQRRIFSLSLPFMWVGLYFLFASFRWWPPATLCLICLSFITYGSVSHDLVHGNLGLGNRTNSFFLSIIELLALRSGHAYRRAHLHHHARYPHTDDIEGQAAAMSLPRALLEGVWFQARIWLWGLQYAKRGRLLILIEGCGCLILAGISIIVLPVTPVLLIYVVLMIMGSWIIPVVTSYVPHTPGGQGELFQTRRFRGRVASIVAFEHLYHLEHHLYPAVPHHHWPALAKKLDPFLDDAGVDTIKFWF